MIYCAELTWAEREKRREGLGVGFGRGGDRLWKRKKKLPTSFWPAAAVIISTVPKSGKNAT